MDKLMVCATLFANLFDYNYHCIIGRKGKTKEFVIEFDAYHFHHLVGLGKLSDKKMLHKNRERVFKDILNSKITYDTISESVDFALIESRLNYFHKLENFMDSNFITFNYAKRKNIGSNIEGEYLLENEIDGMTAYLFIDKGDDLFFGRSFFMKGLKDHTIGQSKWTLLYKANSPIRTRAVKGVNNDY